MPLLFKVNEKDIRAVPVDVFLVFFIEFEVVFTHDDCLTQQTFTCLKSTMEALEKGVKYVQS